MTLALIAVTTDIKRINHVTDNADAAKRIIEKLLNCDVAVWVASETHANNDYWVEVPASVLSSRPEFIKYGVIDVEQPGIGRITGTVNENNPVS